MGNRNTSNKELYIPTRDSHKNIIWKIPNQISSSSQTTDSLDNQNTWTKCARIPFNNYSNPSHINAQTIIIAPYGICWGDGLYTYCANTNKNWEKCFDYNNQLPLVSNCTRIAMDKQTQTLYMHNQQYIIRVNLLNKLVTKVYESPPIATASLMINNEYHFIGYQNKFDTYLKHYIYKDNTLQEMMQFYKDIAIDNSVGQRLIYIESRNEMLFINESCVYVYDVNTAHWNTVPIFAPASISPIGSTLTVNQKYIICFALDVYNEIENIAYYESEMMIFVLDIERKKWFKRSVEAPDRNLKRMGTLFYAMTVSNYVFYSLLIQIYLQNSCVPKDVNDLIVNYHGFVECVHVMEINGGNHCKIDVQKIVATKSNYK